MKKQLKKKEINLKVKAFEKYIKEKMFTKCMVAQRNKNE